MLRTVGNSSVRIILPNVEIAVSFSCTVNNVKNSNNPWVRSEHKKAFGFTFTPKTFPDPTAAAAAYKKKLFTTTNSNNKQQATTNRN